MSATLQAGRSRVWDPMIWFFKINSANPASRIKLWGLLNLYQKSVAETN
jgi:hypothetical protein